MRVLVAMMAVLAALAAPRAGAGAWTLDPGAAFLSSGVSQYRSDAPNPFYKLTVSQYGEYGLTPWLTLGGHVKAAQPVGVSADFVGTLEAGLHARARLYRFADGSPVSVQFGVDAPLVETAPLAEAAEPFSDARFAPKPHNVEIRALAGHGFGSPLGDGWVDGAAGWRLRTGPGSDEFRLDLTFGLRPARDWLVIAQAFASFAVGNGDVFDPGAGVGYNNVSRLKLRPGVGYRINDATTLVLSAEREFAWGEGAQDGTRLSLSLWRSFLPGAIFPAAP